MKRKEVTGPSQPEAVAEVASRVALATPGERLRLRQWRHVAGGIGARRLRPCGIEGVQPIPH